MARPDVWVPWEGHDFIERAYPKPPEVTIIDQDCKRAQAHQGE